MQCVARIRPGLVLGLVVLAGCTAEPTWRDRTAELDQRFRVYDRPDRTMV